MKYKVGDKVRVRGDLEVGKKYGGVTYLNGMEKNKIFDIIDSTAHHEVYGLNDEWQLYYSSEMLRPAEFKIWCETEEEKQAVLEELEKEGYKLEKMANTIESKKAPMYFIVLHDGILYGTSREVFEEEKGVKISPSEFTGIDFLEKIVIEKTPSGASGTYGNKTAEAEGEFLSSAGQVFTELICPFKSGDKVTYRGDYAGQIEEICADCTVLVVLHGQQRWYDFDDLEPYKEPLFSGRAVRVKRSSDFEKGKIYKFVNGFTTDDSGYKRPISDSDVIKNVEMLEKYGFVAIVENK